MNLLQKRKATICLAIHERILHRRLEDLAQLKLPHQAHPAGLAQHQV
ncbi:hypothetical protein KAK11_21270 [Ideonella paludis]|uniref:Uncharacterized protein n=1 Tax=Ideonella paludis TaxID=1233411 RepID=A0ABS5E3B7_9BURK|nr:hypothetical protein [Ideonella paludis]